MKSLLPLLKKFFCLVVISGLSVAHAGSYDDFFTAIRVDNVAKVRDLLARGFDPNTLDPQGLTGLHRALAEPSPKAMQLLADWPKTEVNKASRTGETVLMIAALKGNGEVAKKLISRGGDVNKTGWTPLHYAATGGHVALISLLLENSAYIDAESPNGSTPLMMAALYGSGDAVNLLLQEGADPDLKNQQGLTALAFAQRGNRPDAIKALSSASQASRLKRPPGQW